MALIGKIAIAMGVDTKGLSKGLNSARRDLAAFSSNLTTLGLGVAAFGAAGAVAIGKTILAASNLQEQADRVRDQFGAASQSVINFADTIGTAYGLAKKDTLQAAASFAALFEGAGYGEKAVADLSIHFVRLGTDISRFVNMPVGQALVKLKSGLAGESQAIRELGVSMLESDVEAYAYAKGIAKVNAELTSSQKIQARIGYLTEKFARAQDNLAKTGDKVAGAIEGVKGRFENLSATIGDSLLLVAAPLLGDLQVGLQALQTTWVDVGQSALGSSSQMAGGINEVHGAIGPLQHTIGMIADGWQMVTIAFKGMQVLVTEGIAGQIGNLALLERAITRVVNLIPGTGKLDENQGPLAVFSDVLDQSVQKQRKDLEALRNAPAASEGINKAFEKARKDIQVARDKLAKMGKLDVLGLKPTNAPIVQAGKEHHGFASAAEYGSKESANQILRSTYGMASQGPAQKTAENTAKSAQFLEKISQQLAGAGAAQVFSFF